MEADRLDLDIANHKILCAGNAHSLVVSTDGSDDVTGTASKKAPTREHNKPQRSQ